MLNKICSKCGKVGDHALNANKEPNCSDCFALSRHQWNYMNPTYNFNEMALWAEAQVQKQLNYKNRSK